jgi:hypothetical protein
VSHASVDRATGDPNPPRAKEDIMAIESTLTGTFPAFGGAPRTASAAGSGAAAQSRLLARCRDWLRRRRYAACLRELDPRLALDAGVAPGWADRGPEGFALDPRPLWGIGLTPRPMDARPPRAERRGG